MTDPFEQPQKAVLLRSFEADVARVLNIQKEEAEMAVLKKNGEYEQKRLHIKTVGSKRFFYLTSGFIMLVIAIAASGYLYSAYNKTHTAEVPLSQEVSAIEISPEVIQTIVTSTKENLSEKSDGTYEVLLTKNGSPLSLSELYALLPVKKEAQKADELEAFFYGARVQGEFIESFIIIKEGASRAPQLPTSYDDTLTSLALSLLDLSDEAKALLSDERFTQTHVENVPVRSMVVTTETEQEGIVITRIPETGALLLTTKKTLQNGLLDSLSTSAIVLSL